ncbi:MAG TPA: hypothetical protein PLF91_14420, partial [Mycolicibacterium fallax]|nr:hypothetical protein [Mycolicibacterium fallax]
PFGDDTLRRLAGDPDPAVAFAAVRALLARGGEDNRLLPLARRLFDTGVSNAVVTATLADRGLAEVDWSGWRAIDKAERGRGADGRRPRVKFVTVEELLAASRP